MTVAPVVVGLLSAAAVLLLLLDYLPDELPPPVEPLPADGAAQAYAEALDVALRIEEAAWIAQQEIQAEAIRHLTAEQAPMLMP
jgi:hypothetical protein